MAEATNYRIVGRGIASAGEEGYSIWMNLPRGVRVVLGPVLVFLAVLGFDGISLHWLDWITF